MKPPKLWTLAVVDPTGKFLHLYTEGHRVCVSTSRTSPHFIEVYRRAKLSNHYIRIATLSPEATCYSHGSRP